MRRRNLLRRESHRPRLRRSLGAAHPTGFLCGVGSALAPRSQPITPYSQPDRRLPPQMFGCGRRHRQPADRRAPSRIAIGRKNGLFAGNDAAGQTPLSELEWFLAGHIAVRCAKPKLGRPLPSIARPPPSADTPPLKLSANPRKMPPNRPPTPHPGAPAPCLTHPGPNSGTDLDDPACE